MGNICFSLIKHTLIGTTQILSVLIEMSIRIFLIHCFILIVCFTNYFSTLSASSFTSSWPGKSLVDVLDNTVGDTHTILSVQLCMTFSLQTCKYCSQY